MTKRKTPDEVIEITDDAPEDPEHAARIERVARLHADLEQRAAILESALHIRLERQLDAVRCMSSVLAESPDFDKRKGPVIDAAIRDLAEPGFFESTIASDTGHAFSNFFCHKALEFVNRVQFADVFQQLPNHEDGKHMQMAYSSGPDISAQNSIQFLSDPLPANCTALTIPTLLIRASDPNCCFSGYYNITLLSSTETKKSRNRLTGWFTTQHLVRCPLNPDADKKPQPIPTVDATTGTPYSNAFLLIDVYLHNISIPACEMEVNFNCNLVLAEPPVAMVKQDPVPNGK